MIASRKPGRRVDLGEGRYEAVQRERQRLRAGFDAASLTDLDTTRHWAFTDSLSPNSAANYTIRKRLRDRARYEAKNNTYCRGMVATLAYDTIGRGPRLQLMTDRDAQNVDIETAWRQWSLSVDLAGKLRMLRTAKAVDGEGLAISVTNPRLSPVTLDLRLLECDYLTTPWTAETDDEVHVDGVDLDDIGYPIRYHIMDHHPGSGSGYMNTGKWYPPSRVYHYIYADRAGQTRGIPEITPALSLYAILRRYTLAVLGSAETAADVGGILKSTAGPDTDPDSVEPFLPIEFERRALLTMPLGWEMQQLKAEQPTTTYGDFKHEIINEIARCLHLPYNVAAGNSSDYNYASGRLDHQVYYRALDIERHTLATLILERLFTQWLGEYLAVTRRYLPRDLNMNRYPHRWVWDAFRHVDPMKEAGASIALWQAGLLSDDEYLLSQGIDPEEHYRQMTRELERRVEIGMPRPGIAQQLIEVNEDGKPKEQSKEQKTPEKDGQKQAK